MRIRIMLCIMLRIRIMFRVRAMLLMLKDVESCGILCNGCGGVEGGLGGSLHSVRGQGLEEGGKGILELNLSGRGRRVV